MNNSGDGWMENRAPLTWGLRSYDTSRLAAPTRVAGSVLATSGLTRFTKVTANAELAGSGRRSCPFRMMLIKTITMTMTMIQWGRRTINMIHGMVHRVPEMGLLFFFFFFQVPEANRLSENREAWRQWTELSANKKRTCQRRGKVKKSKRVRVGEKNWRDGEGGNGGKDKLADKGRGLPRGASLWLLSGLGT